MSQEQLDHGVSLNSLGDFQFGLGLEGELIISWITGHLPNGEPLRMHVSIPPADVKILRQGLNEAQTIQEVLAAKPPTGTRH